MQSVDNDQHRWRKWVSDKRKLGVIDDTREKLIWAWKTDCDKSWSYPVHTDQVFFEIKQMIQKHQSSIQVRQTEVIKPKSKRSIESFSELISERTLELVYESQNSGNYQDALNCAAFGRDRLARRTLRRILKAAEIAVEIDQIGIERFPKPLIHLAHKRLLELAGQLGLNGLTHAGILEFVNDLCPCGKKHTLEQIRKLRIRARKTPRL
jgi:hypothetical protein